MGVRLDPTSKLLHQHHQGPLYIRVLNNDSPLATDTSSNVQNSYTFLVDEIHDGERVDLFLTNQLPSYSRTRIQSLIKDGHVTLLEKKLRCRDKVTTGDLLLIEEPEPKTLAKAFPEDIPLTLLYEDDDLLIIDKPAGMVVHVGPDHESGTLVNALLYHFQEGKGLSSGSEPHRPGIVHRLDKETSGCIIIAKNNEVHTTLARGFSERTIKKTYLAIATGKPRYRKGIINLAIGRHPTQRMKMTERRPPLGREAITHYEVLATADTHSLVACYPQTGRMHQIRVHLQHLGHPIAGDPIYGKRDSWDRHLLHAWKLEFAHPRHGARIICEAPLPKDFSIVPFS